MVLYKEYFYAISDSESTHRRRVVTPLTWDFGNYLPINKYYTSTGSNSFESQDSCVSQSCKFFTG